MTCSKSLCCVLFAVAAIISVAASFQFPVKSGSYVGRLALDSKTFIFSKILKSLKAINYKLFSKMRCELIIEKGATESSNNENNFFLYIYLKNLRGPKPEYELKSSPSTLKCLKYIIEEIDKNIVKKFNSQRDMQVVKFDGRFSLKIFDTEIIALNVESHLCAGTPANDNNQTVQPELMQNQNQTMQPESMQNQNQNQTVQPESMQNQNQNQTVQPESMPNQNQAVQPESMPNQNQVVQPESMQNQKMQPESMPNQNQAVQPESVPNQNQKMQPESMSNQNQKMQPESMPNQNQNQTTQPESMQNQAQANFFLKVTKSEKKLKRKDERKVQRHEQPKNIMKTFLRSV